MDNYDKQIELIFYNQKIREESKISSLEGEFEALTRMFSEMQAIGYDYKYLADISMRTIKDKRVMEILYNYYPEMEFVSTKEIFALAIKPNIFPGIVEYAIMDYLNLPTSHKLTSTSFDICISRHKYSQDYILRISELLKIPEYYATLHYTRKKLYKYAPEKALTMSIMYRKGPILPIVLSDYACLHDEESKAFLEYCANISDDEYDNRLSFYDYDINITVKEYWMKVSSIDNIRKIARSSLKKVIGSCV